MTEGGVPADCGALEQPLTGNYHTLLFLLQRAGKLGYCGINGCFKWVHVAARSLYERCYADDAIPSHRTRPKAQDRNRTYGGKEGETEDEWNIMDGLYVVKVAVVGEALLSGCHDM